MIVLSAEDEGRLAWEGAVAAMDDPAPCVGVVDLGGGSCEVAVGEPGLGPTWVSSRDAGALRVARSFFPTRRPRTPELEAGRAAIHELFDGLDGPRPDAMLAVGGTARAVAKIAGRRLGPRKLDALAERIARDGPEAVIDGLDITAERGETLLAGTLVLSEIARRLDSKLEIGSGGLREGAALELARAESAAA